MTPFPTTRRGVLFFITALGVGAVLGGCFEEATGPVEMKYGRDTCTMCNMIISDARFAAQIRGGPKNKVYKFDDIGGALNWLCDKDWGDGAATEIWVADSENGTAWLDAREAFWIAGAISPMDYGFAAVSTARPGAVPFAEAHRLILQKGPPTCAFGAGEGEDDHGGKKVQ